MQTNSKGNFRIPLKGLEQFHGGLESHWNRLYSVVVVYFRLRSDSAAIQNWMELRQVCVICS